LREIIRINHSDKSKKENLCFQLVKFKYLIGRIYISFEFKIMTYQILFKTPDLDDAKSDAWTGSAQWIFCRR